MLWALTVKAVDELLRITTAERHFNRTGYARSLACGAGFTTPRRQKFGFQSERNIVLSPPIFSLTDRKKVRLSTSRVPDMKHRMTAIEAHDVMEVSMPELDDVVR